MEYVNENVVSGGTQQYEYDFFVPSNLSDREKDMLYYYKEYINNMIRYIDLFEDNFNDYDFDTDVFQVSHSKGNYIFQAISVAKGEIYLNILEENLGNEKRFGVFNAI